MSCENLPMNSHVLRPLGERDLNQIAFKTVIDQKVSSKSVQAVQAVKPVVVAQQSMDAEMKKEDSTAWVDRVAPVDRPELGEPRFVAEYVGPICSKMLQSQKKNCANPNYMATIQTDVSERMRGILIDWLVEVHLKFKLVPETLYLAVNLVDRFLSVVPNHPRGQLQLLGVVCLLVASKYEDIYAPEIRDIVHVCDCAYTKEQILAMEIRLLNVLKFNLSTPTAFFFLQRFGKLNRVDEKQFYLAQYCFELSLVDYELTMSHADKPSQLAASALYLANKLAKRSPSWPQVLSEAAGGVDDATLKPAAKAICGILQRVDDNALKAVKKKFSTPRFHNVARLVGTS